MKKLLCIGAFALFALVATLTMSACTDSVLPSSTSDDAGVIIEEMDLGELPRDDVEARASGITGQKAGGEAYESGGPYNCKNRYKYYNSLLANSELQYTYPKSKGLVYAIESGYDGMTITDTIRDVLLTNNRIRFKISCDARTKYVVPNSFQVRFKFTGADDIVKTANIVPTLPPSGNEPNNIFFGTQKYHLYSGKFVTGESYGVTPSRFDAAGVAITPTWTPIVGQLIRFGLYKRGIITEAIFKTVTNKWTIIVVEFNAKCSALKTTKEYTVSASGFPANLKSADGVSVATHYIQ